MAAGPPKKRDLAHLGGGAQRHSYAADLTPPPPLASAASSARRPVPDERAFLYPSQLQEKGAHMEVDSVSGASSARSQPVKCPPTPLRPPPTPRQSEGVTPSIVAARRAVEEELSARKLLFQSPFYPRRRVHKKKLSTAPHKRVRSVTMPRDQSDFSDDEELRHGVTNVPDSESSDETSDDDLPMDLVPSFEFLAKLGEGNFGEVCLVRCCENNREYAVKKLKRMLWTAQERTRCLREVKMWNLVSECPRIVPLIRAWQDDRHFYIQMKYCEGGTLDHYKHGAPLAENELWTALRDTAEALQAIHDQEHVHNDVKPRNMYLSGGRVYLGDFGLMRSSGDDDVEEGDSTYLAPEVLQQRCTTPASDVFALGISFLELAAHVNLPDSGPVWQDLRRGIIPGDRLLRHMPEMERVVRWCMGPDPARRPSCAMLLSLPHVAQSPKTLPQYVAPRVPMSARPASAVFMSPTEFAAASRAQSRTNTPGLSLSFRSGSPFVPVTEQQQQFVLADGGRSPSSEPRRSLLSEFAKSEEAALSLAFATINPSRPTSPRAAPSSQRTTPSASRSVTPVSDSVFSSPALRMHKGVAS